MSLQAFDIELAGNLTAIVPNTTSSSYLHISSLEVCGDYLFLGTKEGSLLRCYFSRDPQNSYQKITLRKATQSLVLNAGSIVQLKALSALNQLLVLSEESLMVVDLQDLKLIKNLKFKNVTSFYINENPLEDDPFSVELCIAGKKKLHILKLSNEQCKVIKELSVNSTPSSVVIDGETVCFSMGLEYYLLNRHSEEIQELFSRDDAQQPPIIYRVTKGEFLLCGPGGLGVFVCGEGFSDKLPIHFPEAVTSITYCHPYIIAVCGNNLHFFSTIDQKSKQVIAISNVQCLINGDGQIFASTAIDVFALHPINTDIQLEKLIKENRLEEALLLANNAHTSSSDKEKRKTVLQNLQNQVALNRFAAGQFYDFLEFTEVHNVDPREIVTVDFVATFSNESLRREAFECFLEYLERFRKHTVDISALEIVDTALLEQYVLRDDAGAKLQELVEKCEIGEAKLASVLEAHGRYHSLAVYYAAKDKLEKSFEVWEQLLKGSLRDKHFPGIDYVAERLARSRNPSLIWRFSQEILRRDEDLGATIFVELCGCQPQTMRDRTIGFLESFPSAKKTVLEFLYSQNPEEESLGNQLVELYIKEIKDARTNRITSLHAATINKLRSVLRTSNAVNLSQVALLLDGRQFPHEYAIISGRLGNHNAAIDIFVNQLKDFDAAEEYCSCVCNVKVWNELLSSCVKSKDCSMYERMVDLLSRKPEEFDIVSALLLLPDKASLSSIQSALTYALRHNLHRRRMKTVEKSLHTIDNVSTIYYLSKLENQAFSLQTSSYCCVCLKQFQLDDVFVRYPNGVLAHGHCVTNMHMCPLTGFLFKVTVANI